MSDKSVLFKFLVSIDEEPFLQELASTSVLRASRLVFHSWESCLLLDSKGKEEPGLLQVYCELFPSSFFDWLP